MAMTTIENQTVPWLLPSTLPCKNIGLRSNKTILLKTDQDERLNHTLNPAEHEDILLAYIEEVKWPNETWINTKTSSAIEFHLKHNAKKEKFVKNWAQILVGKCFRSRVVGHYVQSDAEKWYEVDMWQLPD